MDDADFRMLLRSMRAALDALNAEPLTPEQSAHVAHLYSALRKLSAPQNPSRLKVLVVDDREATRCLLVRQLCDLGCACDGVSAGFRATGRLMRSSSEDPYQAVIIYGGLRDTSAVELAKGIAQDPRWNTKVALIEPVAQQPPASVYVLANPPSDGALRGWLSPEDGPTDVVVMVAEDSRVNQKLAEAMLTRLGYRPLIVDNGLKAVEQHQTPGIVAILMDGQMPEMDGYEATKAIRSREAKDGGHRPPLLIIGVSADAQGRPLALAAGMDDFIHKPLNFEDLKFLLTKRLGHPSRPTHQEPDETFGLDPGALRQLRLVSGDDSLLNDVCQQFLLDLPKRLQALHAAAQQEAWEELARVAHVLKSAARAVGAQGLGAVCANAERCSAANPLTPEWIAALDEQSAQAEQAIRALLGRLGS